MHKRMRRIAAVAVPVLFAGAAVVGSTGTANAIGAPNPTKCSSAKGVQVCWWSGTATAQICDTAADGNTPYMWAYSTIPTERKYVAVGYDGFGNNSCTWAYPPSDFDNGGLISFVAVNETASGTKLSPTGPTVTVAW
ncbi:hypothetical protein P3T36_000041 [Kitasatospora sp. MAP12-15]|uniref:hypothetical protein n=1 Tax=unclassified Kitasatospora TaxID=2633591 RepID=UPI002474FD96|nr:hypothetical protein [Kitasatospora sp. MAP12-44]MDH6109269.1 hypothetical protein [Kitasatospora sp. MAP12-44]